MVRPKQENPTPGELEVLKILWGKGPSTVREVMEHVFGANPPLRGYVVDERGVLRKHMVIFVDGRQISDREQLSDPVVAGSELYVMQALSGGS